MSIHISLERQSAILECLTELEARDIGALYELTIACRGEGVVIRRFVATKLVQCSLLHAVDAPIPEDVRAIVQARVVGRSFDDLHVLVAGAVVQPS